MAKKPGDAPESHNGLNDVIGIVLILFIALPLLCAQLSFDWSDISFLTTRVNKPLHNWIGLIGAWGAYGSFCLLGGAAYLLPCLAGIFGVSYLFNFFRYLREHLVWSLLWTMVLLIAISGVLFISDDGGLHGRFRAVKHINSAGGMLGYLTYGQTKSWECGFCLLGNLGATIVYSALGLISLLFLTNFHLGRWIRALGPQAATNPDDEFKSEEELALEKRAKELEKQKKKLEDEVGRGVKPEKSGSGLGADMQPVPEPTVRDLSVPQAKGPRVRKTTFPDPPKEPAAVVEGEVIPAKEVAAATTEEVLGRKSESKPVESKPAEPKPLEAGQPEPVPVEKAGAGKVEENKPDEPKPEPAIIIADGSVPLPRPKSAPKRPKPMTVASVPMIGNYQLPSLDFLQHPDMTVKPTESKEELMANARLMQQTLAQFDIEVSLGDITKGPTITRYELHPAPGVKLEKISALSNNIAAALKAERIHILAPVPGKSSVGVEVPNAHQDQGHHARFVRVRGMAQHQGQGAHRAGQGRLRPSHHRRPHRDAASADRRQHRLGQVRLHQFHHRVAALPLLARPAPLRDD